MMKLILLVMTSAAMVGCQRPSFAGSRPIGYPVITTTPGLEDRFGEGDGTTQRLPIEANGDRDLVDRLSKLPIDKQPFWFINWQALEAHREKPQTYPQKPNPFIDPPQNSGNIANPGNGNFGNTNTNFANTGSTNIGNSGSTSFANSASANLGNSGIANTGNRNSNSEGTSSSSTPNLANRNSFSASSPTKSTNGNAGTNSGNTASLLEDKFSGGIEVNRFPESENIYTKSSNSKPRNTVN